MDGGVRGAEVVRPQRMSTEASSFGPLMLARQNGGGNVRLVRSPDELVLLAFDTQIKRLVELHLLRLGQPLEGPMKKSCMERARQAAEIRGPTFMRILDVGEDKGVVYYTSNLSDGEFAADYVQRRGALAPATVFSLILQLLDDVMLLSDRQRLVPQIRLDRVMITTVEDTFLQLRLYDFGLGTPEKQASDSSRQVLQICELLFLLLTGKMFAGESPDRYPALTALPMSLRTTVRAALTDPVNTPASLEKLRDDVREAFAAQVSSIQARTTRKQLVVTASTQPISQLQDLLLEGVPVERVLGSRFKVEDEENARRQPFSIPCINAKTEQPVTVHLLPPARIVDKGQYEAVPLQSWRFSPDKHPNILRSLSLWESPDWSFLTEEREAGFALSRLLTERLTLNPVEVVVVLKQVQAGIEQALDCGVQRLELHPSNLFLKVGKPGPMLAREHERLMQKRLDAWPPFLVKVRPHVTLRNLYETPLAEPPDPAQFESEHLADREHRNRTFVALAAYLLTGQRQVGDAPIFSEAVPEALAVYVKETLEATRLRGITPPPAEFLERFEAILTGPTTTDLATRLRGTAVNLAEMESVGSISDFDEDLPHETFEDPEVSPISRRLHPHEFEGRRRAPQRSLWPVWAAAAILAICGGGWWWFSGSSQETSPAPKLSTASHASTQPSTKPAEVTHAQPLTTAPKPAPADKAAAPQPKPTEPVPAKAVTQAPKPAPPPKADIPSPKQPQPVAKTSQAPKSEPQLTTKPMPAPPVVSSAPKPPAPSPAVPAPAKASLSPEKTPSDPAQPPAPVSVPNPVIIRKALMPTPEEIAKFKQGLVQPPAPQPAQAKPIQVTPPTTPQAPQPNGNKPSLKVAASIMAPVKEKPQP